MEPISHIKIEEKIGSCIFNYSDEELMNLYRRAILDEIETYAIEYVCFDINTTTSHDDKFALKFGQLVIDNEEFIRRGLDLDLSKRYYIDIIGPKKFTSDDIIGLPITFKTPITELQFGERIKCFVMITKNISRTHVKWRPVGLVATNEIVEGYFISRLNIGKELKIEKYETHYIDSVIIKKNTTYIDDHAIATLIGELQIDYDNFKSDLDEIKININKKGPGYLITSNDKLLVPFKYHLDIGELSYTNKISRNYNPEIPTSQKYKPQEIVCEITIKKGKRNNLIRWKGHLYDYDEKVTGYQFVINNIGMLSTEKIFEEGLNKIRTAASREQTPITIFHKVRLPSNIPDSIPL
jgi:hypothetical protein